jgi:phenylacetate-CoA ligase
MECGQGLWSRSAYIKHHHLDKYWFQRLGIWRRYVLSTAKGADEHIKLLKRARPDVLRGYVKRLLYLASVIEQKRIGGISPRVVFSMGGVLDPDAREFLESVFKGEVFDFYGATELGCIAWECPRHDGYHVNVDSLVLELISDGRSALPGEPGRIVCTALDLRTMPFIRYDIGDIGIASNKKCSCGRGLPMLESIKGRANDFFVSADGSLYSPPRLLNLLGEVTGISQFRVIQETAEDVTILVVPGRDFSEKSVTAVEAVGAKVFGPRLRVRTSVVSDLPPDTSGKIRCLISRVGERPPNRRERS